MIAVNKNKGDWLTNLDDVWLAVTTKVNPPTTKALLSQQCCLLSLDSNKAVIGISSASLAKLHLGKIPKIEAVFRSVLGLDIKVELAINKVNQQKSSQIGALDEESNLTEAQQLALSRLKSFTHCTDKFFSQKASIDLELAKNLRRKSRASVNHLCLFL